MPRFVEARSARIRHPQQIGSSATRSAGLIYPLLLWRAWPAWLAIALILAAGAALRIIPWLAVYPLHRDEALYGAWARMIAGGSDPLLLTAWVDKPPLVLYLLAASLRAWGVSDLALRLPAMLASLLTVGATYGLARRLANARVALLAAALAAVSPFAILFAPTAFTDPWLTLWLVAGAWAAVARRPFWAGLALGLGVASKQTGIFGAPLVLALLFVPGTGRQPDMRRTKTTRHGRLRGVWQNGLLPGLACLLGFLLAGGPIYWWDTLRWAKRPSFWERSLETYGGLYLAPAADLPMRAGQWLRQAGYLWGTPGLTAGVILMAALGVRQAWRRRHAAMLVLAVYCPGYLAVHWLVTFQPWDRYLLPLVPFLAILAAEGLAAAWGWLDRAWPAAHTAALACLALMLAWTAWLGAAGRVPVGSDHSAFAGLDQAVVTLGALPAQSLIYHHSLGWHLDYYLFDRPQKRIWWQDAATLAEFAYDAARGDPDRPQWLALAWAADAPVAQEAVTALQRRGLRLDERQRIYRPDGSLAFSLYEILLPEQNSQ
jgi:hypothetical protein